MLPHGSAPSHCWLLQNSGVSFAAFGLYDDHGTNDLSNFSCSKAERPTCHSGEEVTWDLLPLAFHTITILQPLSHITVGTPMPETVLVYFIGLLVVPLQGVATVWDGVFTLVGCVPTGIPTDSWCRLSGDCGKQCSFQCSHSRATLEWLVFMRHPCSGSEGMVLGAMQFCRRSLLQAEAIIMLSKGLNSNCFSNRRLKLFEPYQQFQASETLGMMGAHADILNIGGFIFVGPHHMLSQTHFPMKEPFTGPAFKPTQKGQRLKRIRLKSVGLKACIFLKIAREENITNEANDFEFEGDFDEASVIFAHPEVLTGSKRYREVLLSDEFQENAIRVVADEAHCIVDWKGSVQFPRRVVVGECHAAQIHEALTQSLLGGKLPDVFKIPLNTIHVSDTYQTRDVDKNFVEDIKGAMLEKLSLDSVVYLTTVGNPFDGNYILKEDS
ncbi:hypothetical protein ACROYT_G015031 [Oculina patagonica]